MVTPTFHQESTHGQWSDRSISFQLASIGAEFGRSMKEKERGISFDKSPAFDRMIELIDLTIEDPKNSTRRGELCKLRECLCDFLAGSNIWQSSAEYFDRYFMDFALEAQGQRRKKNYA